MKYINPYEIATFIQFNNLDKTTFKKFKRRLSAELELGDGEIIINSIKLHQNEIYELVDYIERNKNLLNIFKSLYENKELHNFLSGKSNENIKRLKNMLSLEDKQTIDFITDYLIQILSKIYKEAFDSNQVDILQIKPPIDEKHYEKIYEPIYKILKNKENEIISLKNSHYNLDDIKNIIGHIKTINFLPEYFTKIRSDIAQAIRNLSIDSWNNNEDLDLALDLINYALKFNVNSKTKDKFLSDKDDLKKIREEQKLVKFLDEIEDVLNNNSLLFSAKADKIINILKQKNSETKDDTVALVVYNLINKYIENNQEVILLNSKELQKLLIYLKKVTYDIELIASLDDDINVLGQLRKKIKEEKANKYASYGMYIGGFIGLMGGFIGLIIGAIIGSFAGRLFAK